MSKNEEGGREAQVARRGPRELELGIWRPLQWLQRSRDIEKRAQRYLGRCAWSVESSRVLRLSHLPLSNSSDPQDTATDIALQPFNFIVWVPFFLLPSIRIIPSLRELLCARGEKVSSLLVSAELEKEDQKRTGSTSDDVDKLVGNGGLTHAVELDSSER